MLCLLFTDCLFDLLLFVCLGLRRAPFVLLFMRYVVVAMFICIVVLLVAYVYAYVCVCFVLALRPAPLSFRGGTQSEVHK